MSAIGLPLLWRLHAKNECGADAKVTANFRGTKLSTTGALSYASTGDMSALFTTTTVANAGTLDGDTQDNSVNKYLGADCDLNVVSTGGGNGSLIIYFQGARSTGNFPTAQSGYFVLAVASTNWAAESTAGLSRSFEL